MYIPKGLKFGQILSKFAKLIAFMEGLQTCFAKERNRVGANPLSSNSHARCKYRCAKQLKTRKNCLAIAPCLGLSGVPLPLFYLELAVFSVFFTQTEQILLFHLVNWTCGVRSATVTQPIYNCLCSHDATALKRRNINRKLGKVTLLVGDHNTTFLNFIFFFKLNPSTTPCQILWRKPE